MNLGTFTSRTARPVDFHLVLEQYRMMRRMGDFKRIMQLIPGLARCVPKEALAEFPDLKRRESIILSMTPDERSNPDLLDVPRKTRIAAGSGTSVNEVSDVVWHVYQMRRNQA